MGESVLEERRKGAEVATDPVACRERAVGMLREFGLPDGLLPLEAMEEFGLNRETGFVWIRQRKSRYHTFKQVGRLVYYAEEVTGFVEKGKIRKLTGVKTKEFLLWLTLTEFFVDPDDLSTITFKTPAGFSRSFPSSAFVLEE